MTLPFSPNSIPAFASAFTNAVMVPLCPRALDVRRMLVVMCILASRASEDMKASRREMDRAFSCPIIVWSYREELPRAYSNRTRINRPVRPYSGHYALTVD